MKRSISFFILLCITIYTHAQNNVYPKHPDFAIVTLADYGDHFDCTVKYSDGQGFSLDKTLDMNAKKGMHIINQDDIDVQEFKIIEYFNKIGYEFVNVIHEINSGGQYPFRQLDTFFSSRFYFKLKGL